MNETQVNEVVAETTNESVSTTPKEEKIIVGKNLYAKLLAVRKRVEYLKKQSGKMFNYVSSSMVVGSLREELDNQGLLLFPHVLDKEISFHQLTDKNGKPQLFIFTQLKMEFEWVDSETGESKTIPFYSQGADYAREGGAGKALTYAEKYFLLKQFNIPTDDLDPDTFGNMTDGFTKNYITDAQVTELSGIVLKIATLNNTSGDTIIQSLGVQSLAKLEVSQFIQAKQYLEGWLQSIEPQMNTQAQTQQQPQQNETSYQVSQEQLPFPDVPVGEQNQQQLPNETVVNGQLTMVTPTSLVNGVPQVAIMMVDQNGQQYQLLVQGLHNVQALEQVSVGQFITIGYVVDGGVPVFTSLK